MRLIFLLACLIVLDTASAQIVEETYPKTLWVPNDTVFIRYKGSMKKYPLLVSRTDKGSPGTDGRPDEYAVLYYGKDSLRISYHNHLPYAHIFYVNFESPKGKTTLRFHFNDVVSYFSEEYMAENTGNIQFDIPEPYELANIIWTFSPSGKRAKDLYREGEYYKRVEAWFKPYLDHPVFKALDFPDSVYFQKYYDFRENSFAFNFASPAVKDTRLLFNGPYYFVMGNDLADVSLFGQLKSLVEDFAAKSKFREFYKQNSKFYQQQLKRQRELLPVKQMWVWLEQQFPKIKTQSYRVVFSPLIGGSHSTQHYSTYQQNERKWFGENVMFICGPDRYDNMKDVSEKQKEGLMSGIVFTEIDHNYVNPETDKYEARVDSIFSNRIIWTKPGTGSDNYYWPSSVFNEYMTHAAFCLYIRDTYDKPTAEYVIESREKMMVDRRFFIRFKEFDQELLRLHAANKESKIVELYPLILEWCKKQI